MACRICGKPEKGADKGAIYICSTCTYIIVAMPKSEVRTVIDKLYLADRAEDAQFVEKIITGGNLISAEPPRLLRRTIPLKIRRR